MAITLVGSAGAAAQSASGASVTPAWGAGAARTAGNLLICTMTASRGSPAVAAPAGWTTAVSHNTGGTTGTNSAVYYKIAAGGDAAPTIAASTSAVTSAQLYEFTGNASAPLDQVGSTGEVAVPPATPQVATAAAADAAPTDLIIAVAGITKAKVGSLLTDVHTINHVTTPTVTRNNTASVVAHYDFAYGISNSNTGANSTSYAFATPDVTGVSVCIASFKAPSSPKLVMIV